MNQANTLSVSQVGLRLVEHVRGGTYYLHYSPLPDRYTDEDMLELVRRICRGQATPLSSVMHRVFLFQKVMIAISTTNVEPGQWPVEVGIVRKERIAALTDSFHRPGRMISKKSFSSRHPGCFTNGTQPASGTIQAAQAVVLGYEADHTVMFVMLCLALLLAITGGVTVALVTHR